jgi:hypothetical protein
LTDALLLVFLQWVKLTSFDKIVDALNQAKVRYLVVGGMAVNAHGYLRFTRDVDLVVRLATADILGAFKALGAIGYRPAVPITAEQFADPALREQWRKEKGMLVLKMWSDAHRETPIDIFVYEPFDFDREYERALRGPDGEAPAARYAAIPALIAMKKEAGRATDLVDIEKLREIEKLSEQ